MFPSKVKPLKFASYKKPFISKKNRAILLTSYDVVHSSYTKIAGMYCDKDLTICEKNACGYLITESFAVKSRSQKTNFKELIESFKSSEGLDFLITSTFPVLLITRQPNDCVKLFMTTCKDYLEVLTDTDNFTGSFDETCINFENFFTLTPTNIKRRKSLKTNLDKKEDTESTNISVEEILKDNKDKIQIDNKHEVLEKAGLNCNEKSKISTSSDSEITLDEEKKIKSDINALKSKNKEFSLSLGKKLSDVEFENLLESNKDFIPIKYGKLKGDKIEFIRQPLKSFKISDLSGYTSYFESSKWDFVEILGSTKISGVRIDGFFSWFAEFNIESALQADDIESFIKVFAD